MANRTTNQAVRDTIETDPDISVDPFIRTANTLTSKIAANDSQSLLNAADLFEIETYLAAYFYALRDAQYAEKKTGDASAIFQGKFGMGFDLNYWGQMAKRMDVTGFLASMDRGKVQVGVTWLGKPPSEQIPYRDRD